MTSSSDGEMETNLDSDLDGSWTTADGKRKYKRKRRELSQEEIFNVILGEIPPTKTINTTKTSRSMALSTATTSTNPTKNTQSLNNLGKVKNNANIHYSPVMMDIKQKRYKFIFHITTDNNYTRCNFTDLWEKLYPNAKDIILSTKTGLLLKTDSSNESVTQTLSKMIETGKIVSFKESSPNTQPKSNTSSPTSYSVIITGVEHEIEDQTIGNFLKKNNLEHRLCRRIISKATNRPTMLIRIITGEEKTSNRLLSEGLYFKYKHYTVVPSNPPPPAPKPCGKCSSFNHPTEKCTVLIKCTKCQGNHQESKCTSPLPSKCRSCGAEDHQAWSHKCPNRPKQPIEGIPNIPIKSINKKSHQVAENNKKSRIHQPLTIHDNIICTYLNEINNPNNTNRQELLDKLRKRFVDNHNIDTIAVFSGNKIYILMFDLEQRDHISPTEPTANHLQYEHGTN